MAATGPPLNYIGSKWTIGPTLRGIISKEYTDLSEITLVDAFCGGCSFTLRTKDLFKNLVLNDLELYSNLVAHSLFHEPQDWSSVRLCQGGLAPLNPHLANSAHFCRFKPTRVDISHRYTVLTETSSSIPIQSM